MVSATLAANPVLSYDWSADSGNMVVDGSGNGNTGANNNSILSTMSNGYKYRTFDTTGKYIMAPSSNSLNPTAITIEAIFSSYKTGVVHQTICLKRDYPNNGYWYGIDVTGQFYFYVMNAGVDRPYLTNIDVTDGNIHYITATYDGQYMKFYDYGVLKDSKDWGSAMPIGTSYSYLYVGAPPEDHPFNGNIYLLRITGRALSASEVAINVNNDRARVASGNGFTINLNAGWNLISLPVLNNSVWASQLGGYGIRRVSLYNNNKGSFDTYVIGFSTADKDIQLKNGNAYFLDATGQASIPIKGTADGPRDVTLNAGWNAVGWSGLSTIKASDLGSRLSSIKRICRYNNANGGYDTYVVGFSSADKNFDIRPGEGYLINLNPGSAGTLRLGGV